MVSTPLKHINQNGKLPQIGAKRTNIWNHNLVLFLGNHFGFIQGGPHHPIFVSGVIRGLLGGPHLVGEKMPVYHPQRNVIDVFKGWTGPGPTWTIGFWRKINFEQRNKTVDYLFLLEESPWTRILSWGLLYIFLVCFFACNNLKTIYSIQSFTLESRRSRSLQMTVYNCCETGGDPYCIYCRTRIISSGFAHND